MAVPDIINTAMATIRNFFITKILTCGTKISDRQLGYVCHIANICPLYENQKQRCIIDGTAILIAVSLSS
jgi:hypothetical protein